ncbi:hypothetical protein Msil_2128 [Methylocella silvestris BL2]|uniref:Uncharacterized protein n=1 Tax=Methylocella silvestris (strain DSM 15510 / CIP 108128 / LMG 27833 / NCIMB 13906 / BL2) TaxID=395965 RepID=B8ERL5_METSB|nr:hypothetical protein [Methylocella silvestris]ACK51067.1 hypothetical protein Msil_2128 [Methylocella silvestris BL2]
MIRLGSIFGFVLSLGLIFAIYMGTPDPSLADSQASAALAEGCVAEKVALDEGYGVTRTETHVVCPKAPEEKAKGAKD